MPSISLVKVAGGVRQDCQISPYLFLIVREVHTYMIKIVVSEGRLRGIFLPRGKNNIASRNTRMIHCLWLEGINIM